MNVTHLMQLTFINCLLLFFVNIALQNNPIIAHKVQPNDGTFNQKEKMWSCGMCHFTNLGGTLLYILHVDLYQFGLFFVS